MTEVEGRTHYEVLGVEQDADPEEIKRAYRKLMRTYHPDVYGPEGEDISAGVTASYAVISDSKKRAEYDEELNAPEEPEGPEPTGYEDYEDGWGTDSEWEPRDEDAPPEEEVPPEDDVDESWGEEVILDDPVVEDAPTETVPSPTDAPDSTGAPAQPPGQEPKPEPVKFRQPKTMAYRVGLAGVLLWLVGIVVSWVGEGPSNLDAPQPRLLLAVGALVGGIILGFMLRGSENPKPRPGRRPKPPTESKPNLGPALGIAIVIAVLLVVLVPAEWRIAAGAGIGLVGWVAATYVATYYLKMQKRLDSFVSMKPLRESNVFGMLPGGVSADLLNRDLSTFCDHPAMRMMRSPEESKPFSHALIVGEKVAIVRSLMASGGRYRWSGPSLLRDQAGSYPQEVMRGPYAQALRTFQSTMGERVEVRAWLFLYDPERTPVQSEPTTGLPSVVGPVEGVMQMRDFFDSEPMLVDHQIVVDAALALNS